MVGKRGQPRNHGGRRRVKLERSGEAKVVGFFPGPFVPEELIYAGGALPVCLAYGGNAQVAEHALSLLPPVICPFARAQVGEMLLKTSPAYQAIDMLIVPSTCQHLRKTGDLWEYYEPTDVFKLGVPYDPDESLSFTYYRNRLADLRTRLEGLTGRVMTDAAIFDAIAVYDRLRQALRAISLMRRTEPPVISGLEFMKLSHASLSGDPLSAVAALEEVRRELQAAVAAAPAQPVAAPAAEAAAFAATPRLMLIAPNVAVGDYGILEMVESAGASIVIEDVFEGMLDYRYDLEWSGDTSVAGAASAAGGTSIAGDPLDALARARLVGRVPAAFMRSSTVPRFEYVSRLIRDFRVQGVIWYELLGCEFYDQDAFFFENRLRDMGIPMLVIESNYDDVRSGSVRTRLEAFLEVVQGGPADA
jgi:benzoyl-CoA reductase/2-hydroxyglutaryl-CoA dehydratase subunit BcrC/BadD/HgdB